MQAFLRRLIVAIIICLAFGRPNILHALRFQEKYTAKGAHILVARDCGNFSTYIEEFRNYDAHHLCRSGKPDDSEGVEGPSEEYVGDEAELEYLLNLSTHGGNLFSAAIAAKAGYGGDSATVETILSLIKSPKPFDEVWLLSGGGSVDAGVGIARVLRRHGMAVEVPAGYQCISACTIAFMGGMLRYIDDQGKFRVHSASGFEGGVNKRMAAQLQANPDSALIKIAQIEQISQRYLALRLYTLFYDTLDLPKNPNPPAENDAEFCKWAGGVYESDTFQDGRTDSGCDAEGQSLVSPHFVYTDPKNTERAADVARIRHEGPAAYQDILMRIERECMAMALKDIESTIHQPDKRTEGAREMLRAMYMTSIMDTSYMTPLQLVTMGYVNKNFGP